MWRSGRRSPPRNSLLRDPRREYLAGVKVTARDANGCIVLADFADGPFLFANLPPGTYRVTAAGVGDFVAVVTRQTRFPTSSATSNAP